MIGLLRGVRERIECSCARLGISYPWWIPAYSTLATVVLTVVAFAQRGRPLDLLMILGALACVTPLLTWAIGRWLLPPWLESLVGTAGVALFLTHQVTPDFAPLVLMIQAGEVAATSAMLVALAASSLQITVLAVAGGTGQLANASIFVVGVILGCDVGIALRWQMRALTAERANTAIASERAILDERQRLAREVHDVVGHTLSVTLLHVTAARHSLQQHADVEDALESLGAAETVGRTAMGDLRRTVAVLGAGASGTAPLPGLGDVAALIERSRDAGLDIAFESSGDTAAVTASTGLGVYRIVQESLANIAKHAPAASARVRLVADADTLALTVRNTLPGSTATPPHPGGTGLRGMGTRAAQMGAVLRAGVDGDSWLVDLTLPAGAR